MQRIVSEKTVSLLLSNALPPQGISFYIFHTKCIHLAKPDWQ